MADTKSKATGHIPTEDILQRAVELADARLNDMARLLQCSPDEIEDRIEELLLRYQPPEPTADQRSALERKLGTNDQRVIRAYLKEHPGEA